VWRETRHGTTVGGCDARRLRAAGTHDPQQGRAMIFDLIGVVVVLLVLFGLVVVMEKGR
jgi:hypothetical protein